MVRTGLNLPDTEPLNDTAGLWALQLELLARSEALFGSRDQSYKLYQPQFYEEGPNLRLTPDQTGVFVELSYNGRFYWPTVVYEMAHESVHLLNPGILGTANYLEEGVAVPFSIYVLECFGMRVQRPSMQSYVLALSLVEALPNDPLESAGRIRRELGRFSNVSADNLVSLFPELDVDVANRLSNKFKR